MEIAVKREDNGTTKVWVFKNDYYLKFRLHMYKEYCDRRIVRAFNQDYLGVFPYTMKKEEVEIPEDVEAEVIETACSKIHVIKD